MATTTRIQTVLLIILIPFLPPANEVWGKVIFSQACVKNSVHRGVPGPEGCLVTGGCLAWAGGPGPSGGLILGGCLWRPPRDGYCCGRYASYWNAFLFITVFVILIIYLRQYKNNIKCVNTLKIHLIAVLSVFNS